MAELLLTVDTCSASGSVAVSRGDTLLGEMFTHLPGTHSDRLLLTAQQLLDATGLRLEEVDAFGIVHGPGSFTGVRVGVATVKGLAMATGRPVVGVSSLRTLALQAPFSRFPVCALLDARKKEVYAGLFGWEGGVPVPLGPESVLPPDRLLEKLEGEALFIGDGALAYRTLLVRRLGSRAHFAPWPFNFPRAGAAAALALADFRQGLGLPPEQVVPHYIRPSEAEILWAREQERCLIEG